MNERIRKFMAMHKALHPRDDINRVYLSKKEKEYSPALRITLMYPCNVSRTILKRGKRD